MRSVRQQRLFRRFQTHGTEDAIRFGEFLVACFLLAMTLPLSMVVALAINWESPVGPIFTKRTRMGRNGRPYYLLKFRITVHEPAYATPPWGQQMTRVGQFLRYTRIEALPRLINVVRGEMNLINRDDGSPSFLD
jgi:lipopolysaccharide/colanic/teichoic acid biosynthesis glycosyltransferase